AEVFEHLGSPADADCNGDAGWEDWAQAQGPQQRTAIRPKDKLDALKPPQEAARRLAALAEADGGEAADPPQADARPDGKVRLRVFDGKEECRGLAVQLACVVLGSTLRMAHVA
ncbi:unnamed protein product, partial [Prorocentrum cordatum]